MAKFQLHSDEILIGSGQIAYYDPYGLGCAREIGRVYVTNQRLLHRTAVGVVFADLPLSEISGFQPGRLYCLIPKCTVYTKQGDFHIFADFQVSNLLDWLREAGVPQM